MSAVTEAGIRYPKSVDPVSTDGRNVDTEIATLEGEGSQQLIRRADMHAERIARAPYRNVPGAAEGDVTYYGRPLLKRSVWSIDIPLYYFVGGAAGAAMTLGAAIQLISNQEASSARPELRRLSTICHWIGIAGSTSGAAFLIHDLGRPSRFLYMMRVFRPTSPMNMGVWILSGAAPAAITTGLLINRQGLPGRIGESAGYASGVFGAALAGYTGVLVSNSAIPLWLEARRWVPAMFTASSASAAASIVTIVDQTPLTHRIMRVFGTAARAAELAAGWKVEQAAKAIPKVAEPLRQGGSGFLWRTAAALTAASLGLSLFARKSRKRTIAAGWLGAAGSLALRLAVHYASEASAADPRGVFRQQRFNLRRS